jgi:hypothetical protein
MAESFNKKEITTILAGLRYLQANLDAAAEAMSDLDDSSGEDTKAYLLTEKEIDALCERINLGGRWFCCREEQKEEYEKEHPMMTIFVVYIKGQVKGILNAKEYLGVDTAYWDELKPVDVPIADWNAEKVTVATIKNYL